MSRQKKAPGGAGTPTEAAKRTGQTSISQDHHIISRGSGSTVNIYPLIPQGRDNAVGLRDLVRLTGLEDRRVRMLIQRERLAGRLILSDNEHGYFRPDNPEEVRRFVRSMTHRAKEICKTITAAENALADLEHQTSLWEAE